MGDCFGVSILAMRLQSRLSASVVWPATNPTKLLQCWEYLLRPRRPNLRPLQVVDASARIHAETIRKGRGRRKFTQSLATFHCMIVLVSRGLTKVCYLPANLSQLSMCQAQRPESTQISQQTTFHTDLAWRAKPDPGGEGPSLKSSSGDHVILVSDFACLSLQHGVYPVHKSQSYIDKSRFDLRCDWRRWSAYIATPWCQVKPLRKKLYIETHPFKRRRREFYICKGGDKSLDSPDNNGIVMTCRRYWKVFETYLKAPALIKFGCLLDAFLRMSFGHFLVTWLLSGNTVQHIPVASLQGEGARCGDVEACLLLALPPGLV